jgi:hypothetical protein
MITAASDPPLVAVPVAVKTMLLTPPGSGDVGIFFAGAGVQSAGATIAVSPGMLLQSVNTPSTAMGILASLTILWSNQFYPRLYGGAPERGVLQQVLARVRSRKG